ncbi:MAG TPA: hypothetical protein VF710_01390, partial [Longimicrobium sp.]
APICLVRARYAAEPLTAVPVDQIVVTPSSPPRALMLPPGDFTVRVEGADGALLREERVRVGAD